MTTDPCVENVLCHITGLKTDMLRLEEQQDAVNQAVAEFGEDLDTVEEEVDALEAALEACCEEDETPLPTALARTITSEEELEAAQEAGGKWFVISMVELTHTYRLAKSLQLIGFSLDGGPVGFSLNYLPGATSTPAEGGVGAGRDMFRPAIGKCEFRGLTLTTNHPLTSGFTDTGACIAIYGEVFPVGDPQPDFMSDIVIEDCNIYKTAKGIYRETGVDGTIAVLKRLRIVNNYIHAWSHDGVYLRGALEDLLIDNNVIAGRDSIYSTHTTLGGQTGTGTGFGNCINVGQVSDRSIISRNKCLNTDRHAIEVFNSITGGTKQTQVINNVCTDCFFGVSCTGNQSFLIDGNSILRAQQIGIECVGFRSGFAEAEFIVTNNSIKDTFLVVGPFQPNPTEVMAISIDGVKRSMLICNNQISKVTAPPTKAAHSIHIMGRNPSVESGCENITIRGNRFYDGGDKMILINGAGSAGEIYNGIEIEGNTFYQSSNYLTLIPGLSAYYSVLLWGIVGSVVVRNNTSFIAKELPVGNIPNVGVFGFVGTGKVFDGVSFQNPIDNINEPETVGFYVTGTNIRVVC